MTLISDIADRWLGLCRKPPVIRVAPTVSSNPPEPVYEGRPRGGADGPGTIRRGIGAAVSGIKTLIHNPQLLWFTLLFALVLAGNSIIRVWLVDTPNSSGQVYSVDPAYAYFLQSFVLTGAVGFSAAFCLVFLMAGLVLALSVKKDCPHSAIRGLALARKYLIPLTAGAATVTLAGILLLIQPYTVQGMLFVRNPEWMIFIDHDTVRFLSWFILTFAIEFLMAFCLVFLMAGLVLALSVKKDCPPLSAIHGLALARKYLIPLTMVSVAMALTGTLLFTASQYSTLWEFVTGTLNQFPFHYVLSQFPYETSLLGGYGSSGIVFIYSLIFSAVNEYTLILSAINVLLFILTLFVVPLIVLEKTNLTTAVFGSFTLMRKIWGEAAACVLGLGGVVFSALLLSRFFQFSGADSAWWDASVMYTTFTNPGGAWIAAGFLYVFALSGIAYITVTVGGIATLTLYNFAKTGQAPGSAGSEPLP